MLDVSNDERLKNFPSAKDFHDYLCTIQLISRLKSAMFSSTFDSCGVRININDVYEFLTIGSSSTTILSAAQKFFESKGYEFICDFKNGYIEINWR